MYMRNKIFCFLIFIFLCIPIFFISKIKYTWPAWKPATCLGTKAGCFCEAISDGIFKQPVNTWSSLAFVLVGILIIGQIKTDINTREKNKAFNLMAAHKTYGYLLAIIIILNGLGAGFYHASLSFVGQTADVFSMFLLATFMILYNLQRFNIIGKKSFIVLMITTNMVLLSTLILIPGMRRILFAVLLLSAVAGEVIYINNKKPIINLRYLFFGALIIATAFGIWILDIQKIWCNPTSLVQGHGFWHILGAVATGFLYLYYRSEST